MLYSVALCAQISSCCSRVDIEDYVCKAGKVVSMLDTATTEACCLSWEALKVNFALEALEKKHLYVSRTCVWSWCSATEKEMSVDRFLTPTSNVNMAC